MNNLPSLILLCALVYVLYKCEKKLNKKTEYYQWILREQKRFHLIAQEFDKECQKIIEQYFPMHTNSICRNRKGTLADLSLYIMFSNNQKLQNDIANLKELYLSGYPTKYESHYGTFYFENYPNYIFDDYAEEIGRIYNHYYFIASLMRRQVDEMRSTPSIDQE